MPNIMFLKFGFFKIDFFFIFIFFLFNDALLITYTKKKFGYSTATRQIDYLQRVYYIYIYLHQ